MRRTRWKCPPRTGINAECLNCKIQVSNIIYPHAMSRTVIYPIGGSVFPFTAEEEGEMSPVSVIMITSACTYIPLYFALKLDRNVLVVIEFDDD